MVDYIEARLDIEETLTRTITLKKKTIETSNEFYGNESISSNNYTVKCQMTIQRAENNLVRQGILKVGDAVSTFRYEYSEEVDGTEISPVVVVALKDELTSNSKNYEVEEIHEITDEEGNLICWEARMVRI